MSTKMHKKQRFLRIASMITLLIGAILVTYMITIEGELGAIPLLLLTIGIVLFIMSTINFKK